MQRFFDVVFSGLAVIALIPVIGPLMLVLRLTGEGEIFFRQPRVGLGGEHFQLLKFATMLKDSPNMHTGTVTVNNDPRVLPVGRFLRATKLNELPQLFNVLTGDMSLIGPRPQTQRCFDAFPPESQAAIIKVRPGLSGAGSIVFRGEQALYEHTSDPDWLYDNLIMPYKGELEQWYVANRSLKFYFLLLIITAWVVVRPQSAIFWRTFPDAPRPPEGLALA